MSQDISQYKDSDEFILVELVEHTGESKEYKVEGVGGGLVILREKGKSQPKLLNESDIVSFEAKPAKPQVLKAKRLNPVDDDKVKRHLVDMHAYRVSDINGITVEDAVQLHNEIDHKELDLGHFHAVSKREQAIAEGGPSSDAHESQNEEQSEDD